MGGDSTSAHMTLQLPDACRENGSHGGSGPLAPGWFWFFGTRKVLVYWHQEISLFPSPGRLWFSGKGSGFIRSRKVLVLKHQEGSGSLAPGRFWPSSTNKVLVFQCQEGSRSLGPGSFWFLSTRKVVVLFIFFVLGSGSLAAARSWSSSTRKVLVLKQQEYSSKAQFGATAGLQTSC